MGNQNLSKVIGAIASAALFSVSLATNASGEETMSSAEESKLGSILAGDHRNENNAARDKYRNPSEVLKFFRLKEDMAVMEIWPAGGWWTEVLAPFLSENGRYVAAHYPAEGGPAFFSRSLNSFKEKLADNPEEYGKVEIATLMPNMGESEPVAPGSMDLVVTFRNVHNWMSQGSTSEMVDVMYAALKPGGYLGVVEHRASTDQPQDPKAQSGYVREDYAIQMMENAGFKLVAKSEVNANPKDTKDYESGVWTLPPVLRKGDEDRDKYTAIGESDRFTLLFQKAEN